MKGSEHVAASIKQLTKDMQEGFRSDNTEVILKCVNDFDLLTRSVCKHHANGDFSSLAAPLMRRVSGAAAMFTAGKHILVRLRYINMVNRLAVATSAVGRIASLLVDMLEMLQDYPKHRGASVDFSCVMEVNDDILHSESFQKDCVRLITMELVEDLTQQSHFLAFPEFSDEVLLRLKYYIMSTPGVGKIDRLINKIENNAVHIMSRREGVKFGSGSSILQVDQNGGVSPLLEYLQEKKKRKTEEKNSPVETKNEDTEVELPSMERMKRKKEDSEVELPSVERKKRKKEKNSPVETKKEDTEVELPSVERKKIKKEKNSPVETKKEDSEVELPSVERMKRKKEKNSPVETRKEDTEVELPSVERKRKKEDTEEKLPRGGKKKRKKEGIKK